MDRADSWSSMKEGIVLHAGLDLGRKRVDVCLVSGKGELVDHFPAPADRDGLHGLARRVAVYGRPVRAVIESMNGARFVHDELIKHGWEVLIADAQRVKGLAPLACKTDKVDARVLAELSFRDLVPAIWLPDPRLRRERERARFRLHLVKHRTSLKNRVHSTLICFGHQRSMSDLFGVSGRQLLERLEIPEPWRSHLDASLQLIDDLTRRIEEIERDLRRSGADHRYVPLLLTAPGIGWVLAYKERYQRTKRRLGKQRGPNVAKVELARQLAEAIWHMLTRSQPFAPAGAAFRLAA
jgi:transposase